MKVSLREIGGKRKEEMRGSKGGFLFSSWQAFVDCSISVSVTFLLNQKTIRYVQQSAR